MRRPEHLWDQYRGKAFAELMRGSGGGPPQAHPCALEPPWSAYDRQAVTAWDCYINDWEGPWEGSWLKRALFPGRPLYRLGRPLVLPETPGGTWTDLSPIVIERFPGDEATLAKAEQFLLSLPSPQRPLAFEVLGVGPRPQWDSARAREIMRVQADGRKCQISEAICGWDEPYTAVQFVADPADAELVRRQLLAHYPNSAIVVGPDLDRPSLDPGFAIGHEAANVTILGLETAYCWPLKTVTRPDPDPLGVAIAALDHLERDQWGLLQVLFEPACQPWADTLREALRDPYNPSGLLLGDLPERVLREKFASPLFAVSVRLVANTEGVFRHLAGWAEQFAAPPQRFVPLGTEEERRVLGWSVLARCTHRPGMLLNLSELAGLVHVPSDAVASASERLRRVKSRTRPAVAAGAEDAGSVVLGLNEHRGERRPAVIPAAIRPRHCYIAGASGTGKSTLLLHMILQDICQGAGVGVLDPHGDLIAEVLARIPPQRRADTIYFNGTDTDYPVGLNILHAHDASEREPLVAETVAALRRFFPDSWGPRLEHILTHVLATTVLIRGGTLREVRRLLCEQDFRYQVVARLRDPDLVAFWTEEFPNLPKGSLDPIFNKLSPFLLNRTVRNIVCQRETALDFDTILNQRQILLANLSTGLLTEPIANILGSFLVTKIVQAAFRRARLPRENRTPWYLYVDEFQNFMDLATGFDRILAEARKYQLVLAGLANQYVGQLSSAVRAAIVGNVGTMIAFRLGFDDARLLAHEFGVFTAEEILNLERGQALARVGSSQASFNLTTYPEPPRLEPDPTAALIAASRQRYARPRLEVERELSVKLMLAARPVAIPPPPAPATPTAPPTPPGPDPTPPPPSPPPGPARKQPKAKPTTAKGRKAKPSLAPPVTRPTLSPRGGEGSLEDFIA